MEVVFAHCAGLDVHKKIVVACVFVSDSQGEIQRLVKTFQTTLAGLEALAAWLSGLGVRHPRQSRWLDELDRLKGGRTAWLTVANIEKGHKLEYLG